jgi:putative transposase
VPRPPRLVIPKQSLHLIQRGNNRAALFLSSEEFRHYQQLLHDASVRTACAIHAYVLMTNHVHLLITPTQPHGPARLMQMIGRTYVRWFNSRRQRTGTLWEGRYRSTLIDSDAYLLTCSRYIELNPVRAGIVDRPDDYPWSSFRRNARGGADSLVTPHALYDALGDEPAKRCEAYRALFRAPLDSIAVNALRRATQNGTVLGRPIFLTEVEHVLDRRLSRCAHGGDRRSDGFKQAPVRCK